MNDVREVESSVSSFAQEHVGTSSGGGDMTATSSQEEMLDSEVEVDDDEAEISEGLEEVESQDLNAEGLEGTTDEDENNAEDDIVVNSEEEIEVDVPEAGVGEDNSSEPSSSTGTSRVTGVSGSGYDHDQGDTDSVVPTTPKLPLPRRNDGFAEAVSSPQVICYTF